jgi:hypothetical protein
MTGRQEYDRTKDRQRILGKYMIDSFYRILSCITCVRELHYLRGGGGILISGGGGTISGGGGRKGEGQDHCLNVNIH